MIVRACVLSLREVAGYAYHGAFKPAVRCGLVFITDSVHSRARLSRSVECGPWGSSSLDQMRRIGRSKRIISGCSEPSEPPGGSTNLVNELSHRYTGAIPGALMTTVIINCRING